jgi:ABC-2 type transport system ATP-binding protein
MEYIIEIDGLTKDYEIGFWRKKKVRALDGLDLRVKRGGIFGFLGGNGAGKTTTIKILMSLMTPTAGSAKILGSDISDPAMHSRIGYCPENPYFYDYLTANELMDYFGAIFGLDAAKRREKTDELLTSVGLLEKDRGKQLRKFSKGMLQRVGLAQALINDPEIVFLDEPMSGLDPMGRREIRDLIGGLREKGTSVFMSTHILSDVEALCDEVAILRQGKLAATGNLSDLLANESGSSSFEIIAADVTAEKLAAAGISAKQNGSLISIEAADENEVEKGLAAIRAAGGKLVSVSAVKRSLEELFVTKTA